MNKAKKVLSFIFLMALGANATAADTKAAVTPELKESMPAMAADY